MKEEANKRLQKLKLEGTIRQSQKVIETMTKTDMKLKEAERRRECELRDQMAKVTAHNEKVMSSLCNKKKEDAKTRAQRADQLCKKMETASKNRKDFLAKVKTVAAGSSGRGSPLSERSNLQEVPKQA